MVNRNGATVNAVFVAGRAVTINREPTRLLGQERTGGFLRAGGQERNLPVGNLVR